MKINFQLPDGKCVSPYVSYTNKMISVGTEVQLKSIFQFSSFLFLW